MCKTVKLITWLFLFLKGVIKLKVITEKGGVKARSVNDKAIEHSIAKKTELSKRNEKELTSRTERTVHHADRNAPKPDKKEMQINRTIPNKRSGRAVSSVTANNVLGLVGFQTLRCDLSSDSADRLCKNFSRFSYNASRLADTRNSFLCSARRKPQQLGSLFSAQLDTLLFYAFQLEFLIPQPLYNMGFTAQQLYWSS